MNAPIRTQINSHRHRHKHKQSESERRRETKKLKEKCACNKYLAQFFHALNYIIWSHPMYIYILCSVLCSVYGVLFYPNEIIHFALVYVFFFFALRSQISVFFLLVFKLIIFLLLACFALIHMRCFVFVLLIFFPFACHCCCCFFILFFFFQCATRNVPTLLCLYV